LGYVYRLQIGEVITNNTYEAFQLSSSVYPNPVTDLSKIIFSVPNNHASVVQIIDIEGKLIDEFSASPNTDIIIPVSKLSAGMYLYIIKDENSILSNGKFIVN
jgi:hypothetical protein